MSRKNTTRRGGGRGRRRSSSFLPKFMHRYPRWAWWIGGIAIILVYIWAFYYFFVSPTGFRWRALYGDAEYPEGYEIHGIDISHYQGEIDWEQLKNAMIEGCPVRFVIIKSTEGASRLDDHSEKISIKYATMVSSVVSITSGAISLRLVNKLIISWTRYI